MDLRHPLGIEMPGDSESGAAPIAARRQRLIIFGSAVRCAAWHIRKEAVMTPLKSALTAAALSAILSFGAYAGDAGVTPEQIAAAKTAADHEAIAAAYDQEAARLEAKARDHEKMARAYASAGSKKGMQGAAMRAHCARLTEQYSAAAKENRELAREHRAMEHSQ